MPNKLRQITSEELIGFLKHHGFFIKPSNHGHTKLEKTILEKTADGKTDERTRNIVVPYNKKGLDKGLLRDTFDKLVDFVPALEINNFFFTDRERESKEMRREENRRKDNPPPEMLPHFGLK